MHFWWSPNCCFYIKCSQHVAYSCCTMLLLLSACCCTMLLLLSVCCCTMLLLLSACCCIMLLHQAWAKSQQHLISTLHPGSHHIVVNGADHHMLYRKPLAVSEPIRKLIHQWRRRWPPPGAVWCNVETNLKGIFSVSTGSFIGMQNIQ